MDSQELRDCLSRLELSQTALAKLLGVTPRAVSLWLAGTRSVPGPVNAYLRLIETLPIGMREAELARNSSEMRSMKDGMYTIEYAGTAGSGHCTLVFDGGRIYGVDPTGGKYDGQYQFNQDTGLVEATIRVEMPGGVPSVVGIQQPFDWILEVSAEMNPDLDEGHISLQTNLGQPINAYYRFIRTLPQAA